MVTGRRTLSSILSPITSVAEKNAETAAGFFLPVHGEKCPAGQ